MGFGLDLVGWGLGLGVVVWSQPPRTPGWVRQGVGFVVWEAGCAPCDVVRHEEKFKVSGLELRIWVWDVRIGDWTLGSGVQGLKYKCGVGVGGGRVQVSGFGVCGFGFRIQGLPSDWM